MPKKIPFFTTLTKKGFATVNRKARKYGLKRWQVIDQALEVYNGGAHPLLIELKRTSARMKQFSGGPRRKARGRK